MSMKNAKEIPHISKNILEHEYTKPDNRFTHLGIKEKTILDLFARMHQCIRLRYLLDIFQISIFISKDSFSTLQDK